MQRKDLALRVLSTAAIMSIVTSIAAPAFAGTYYIGKGSIDVVTSTDGEHVHVIQNGIAYIDRDNEIVIKDGTDENDTTLKDADRAAATPAGAPAAGAATLELEAAGTAAAAGPTAGESQPDPDDAFTLSEEEEDSAQTQEGKDTTKKEEAPPKEPPTENPTENHTKDVVYQYDAADPEPEQQATKPTLSASAEPEAAAREATLADAPTATPAADTSTTTPAEGSAEKPTKNVIRVINNWAKGVLNIRLSNVNIKSDDTSRYADGKTDVLYDSFHGVSAAEVQGTGNTQIELDGQNVLDSSACQYWAGLSKKGSGNLTITDKTSDKGETIKDKTDTSGSLRAEGGTYGGAAIGGSCGQATDNITIEGYATVKANTLGYDAAGIGGGGSAKGSNITIQGHANVTADGGLSGAGIGGGSRIGSGCGGDAENITIQDYAKVTATGAEGAAIGSGSSWSSSKKNGDAKNIVICGHATVNAKTSDEGAAIGAAGYGTDASAEVIIGTAGATVGKEDVHVTATSKYGVAIGNGAKDTHVTIQGHTTIWTASSDNSIAIGSNHGKVTVNINDNASIDTATGGVNSGIGGGYSSGRTVEVNIDGGKNGNVRLGENSAITAGEGAISGTTVNIGDNVLLKMKQKRLQNELYINVNGTEAAVGTRSNPDAGGLVNTIGNNTQLWYTDFNGVLQKIVHSKNLCKKELVGETAATCTTPGSKTYKCTFESFESNNSAVDPEHTEQWTENTAIDPDAHDWGDWEVTTPATCTEKGEKTRKCRNDPSHVERQEIPATGHHWKDNGDGTHTCTNCGATEGQPFNTNSALELRVVDAEGMDQPFTVSQNGTLRTYTGAYDIATLTGDLNTLRYLQDHGAQTIQFVTNGQTSSFDINDLLAQGSGNEVFYLTHRGAEEPTLLLVEADHSELVKD